MIHKNFCQLTAASEKHTAILTDRNEQKETSKTSKIAVTSKTNKTSRE